MIRYLLCVMGSVCCFFSVTSHADSLDTVQPRIVIVIDDIGNNLAQGQAALALPGPITYAVLPHSAYGETLARAANSLGKDVMLHAPMSNTKHLKLGPGALTPDMSETRFKEVLNNNLDAIPFAVGLNNHMGSLLTRQRIPMKWVMDVAKSRSLFFLDSRTTRDSVAWEVALSEGVPALRRDVFLDNQQSVASLRQQFIRAVKLSRQHGYAVVIGHPYPVTTEFLEEAIPALDEAGIQLVSAPALLMLQQQTALLAEIERELQSTDPQPLSGCDLSDGHQCE
ncbi:divergent polysaccharide deacetylase family protein [Neptunomonas antarctica]|uniref:Divergent polysaccharide deacetylase n=1 Tax=Neptunomonas antarctica TaxID=619304 RepID=A0A1N7PNN8_9GAMM|nr:divergent polysaccharide deacetylase family protein [Neptunomonas antarctica]SIT12100.1 hypothetical protein SAMN05421760_11720 [Neptunomonas antarctica]